MSVEKFKWIKWNPTRHITYSAPIDPNTFVIVNRRDGQYSVGPAYMMTWTLYSPTEWNDDPGEFVDYYMIIDPPNDSTVGTGDDNTQARLSKLEEQIDLLTSLVPHLDLRVTALREGLIKFLEFYCDEGDDHNV